VEWPLAWRSRWIWCGPAPIGGGPGGPRLHHDAFDRVGLFRLTFELPARPRAVPVRLTADSRYVLWVNGHEVARGPVRSQPHRLRYDETDLAPWLQRGRNVIAAAVRFYGYPTPWWMPAPPTYTLGGGGLLLEGWAGKVDLATGADWRAVPLSGWLPSTPGGIGGLLAEQLDARRVPSGWREPAFDDSGWGSATELDDVSLGTSGRSAPPFAPYGPLLPRPIGDLGGKERVARFVAVGEGGAIERTADPVDDAHRLHRQGTMVELESPTGGLEVAAPDGSTTLAIADLGEVCAGTLELDLDAPSGTVVLVAAAERLDGSGRLLPLAEHAGLRYIARGRDDHVETLDPIGARYLGMAVQGPGFVQVRRLAVRERLHPWPHGAVFRCSDPNLEHIWTIGQRTVALCSQDAFIDCPTREQRAWTGDAVVHQQVHLATNPDTRLARWNVELAASPRADGMLPMAVAGNIEHSNSTYIPDWSLHWVRTLHNIARHEADADFVASLLPVAERVVRWFDPFRQPDGLLHHVTGWVLVDWASVHVRGASAALNALWARALADVAELAAWLGDERAVRWCEHRRDGVHAGFEAFWDERRGVYVDHLVDGRARKPVSEHANVTAVAAGLVPVERLERVLTAVTDRDRLIRRSWVMERLATGDLGGASRVLLTGPPPPDWDIERRIVEAEPFYKYVSHEAFVRAGRADLIGESCRLWQTFVEAGETTWPETWHGGTRCHGWSSTPTADLPRFVAGIRAGGWGWEHVVVSPAVGDLEWVEARVPTPHGWVSVRVDARTVFVDAPRPIHLVIDGSTKILVPGAHTIPR